MSTVRRGANESLEGFIRRFTRLVERDGIIPEARRREAFETNAEKAKRKAEKAAATRRRRSRSRE
jgi:small subunit ribosomal protein S21